MKFWFTLRHLCESLSLCVFALSFLTSMAAGQQPDRHAFTFTKYDLKLTIDPVTSLLAARGTVTLRNDSPAPQTRAVMQLSSQLKWASIKIAGKPLPFDLANLASDIDHTGQVTEATFTLPHPIAPKASIEIEVGYSGNITQNAARLTKLGMPEADARASDWDRISPDFTGMRGVGHTVWYPVAMDPAILGRGNQLFVLLGEFRARHAESFMKLDLGRFTVDHPGTQLFSNGVASLEDAGQAHKETVEFSHIGLEGPLLIAGKFANVPCADGMIFYQPKQNLIATQYADAAKTVASEIPLWLRRPQQTIQIIQSPDANAAPFESGAMLFTPFLTDEKSIEVQLAHTVAHAAVPSSRAWISEGLAHYAQVREREVQGGRQAALKYMFDRLGSLAIDEPESEKAAADSAARSLVNTGDEVLYRTKAMYVWWMLHEMLGDDPLRRALRNYRAADDGDPRYMQHLIEDASHRDLEWFFSDWVYRDRGLPDFRIAQVYPRQTLENGYLVTVTIENLGDAGAEVPVRVITKQGETVARIEVMGKSKGSARLNTLSLPLQVIVNDGSVPESDLSNNMWKAEEK